MYAVIFRAEINCLDEDYSKMAKKMRDLAINKYGCSEFTSTTEGKHEIAISYWNDLQQIKSWKEDEAHLIAQSNGKHKWYKNYHVQIVDIIREYSSHS